MNIRYRAYLNVHPEEEYHFWIIKKIKEWANFSGRAKQMEKEHKDGWHFPVLVSKECHLEFDEWLEKEENQK